MEKVLELVFEDAAGSKKVLKVSDPKDEITAETAKEAMNTIISADVFETAGGKLSKALEARIRTTQISVLE